ncbi:PIH1D3 [Brachionus plicatilis]|uniref:PIH1D3 n=1 Tax=Brachionus plicatilis TaxID=10195 RepID=A0A3M7RE32_BRAPC|nr:PIH1D3 [Brachionus plicatilis]
MSDLTFDIKSLETLLRESNDESSDDEDQPIKNLSAKLGPGCIGPNKKETSYTQEKNNLYAKKQSKNIWDEDEVEAGAEYDTSDDPRIQPEYDILFKQKLSSEELFLQMGNKTAATSSCEDMVIKIKLPGVEKVSEIDINTFEKFLDCRTLNYRLGLHLPHPVNPKTSSAKWDQKNSTLIVTMTMNREYDFVNF